MTIRKLVAITQLGALPEASPRLVNGPDGRRFVCIRRGERVDVLDDRCPHEGHPLSMGVLNGSVLTCQWHNWKFDIESGACRFGGESVRRYEADVVDGELFVEIDEDAAARQSRVVDDLGDAVTRESVDGIVRNGLRCIEPFGSADAGLAELARIAASRSPWGLRGSIVALDAVSRLVRRGVIDRAEALAIAGTVVVHDTGARGIRPDPRATVGPLDDAEGFLLDLIEERRAEATARVAGLPERVDAEAIVRAWFVPFVSMKLWDRGAARIRTGAAARVASWVDRDIARSVCVAQSVALGWAVSESDLPPWRATRQALLEARTIAIGHGALDDRDAFRAAVLASERDAVGAVIASLRNAVEPGALLDAIRDAASMRLSRYDSRHSRRVGVDVTALEPARAFVFAHEALSLGDSPFRAAHAVLAAGLVGKLARFDRSARGSPSLLDSADASRRAPATGDSVVGASRETSASFADAARTRSLEAMERSLAEIVDDEIAPTLRDLVREALLGSRSPATLADACALAAAASDVCDGSDAERRRFALRAFANAMFADDPDRLDRLAANAGRFVRDGTPPEML